MEMKLFAAVFGQMNIDLIFHGIDEMPQLGKEIFASNFAMCVGGGPIVIPYHLSKLGVPSKLGTILEKDFESEVARDLLKKIDYKNIVEFSVNSRSPVVFTTVLTSKKERSFISFNAHVDERAIEITELLSFYAGSSVAIFPQNIELAKQLDSQGIKLILDSSWSGILSLENYIDRFPFSEFFTPNSMEAKQICGQENLLDCLDKLEKYLKFPIIKMGESGVITKKAGKYFHIPPVKTFDPIDPTGAGDNFIVGLMYGMWKNYDLFDTLKCANILGGLSTEVLGCFRADLTASKLEKHLLEHPQIHEVHDEIEFVGCVNPY